MRPFEKERNLGEQNLKDKERKRKEIERDQEINPIERDQE